MGMMSPALKLNSSASVDAKAVTRVANWENTKKKNIQKNYIKIFKKILKNNNNNNNNN
jgi:hypothetical protein